MIDAITGDRTRARGLGSPCPTARLLSQGGSEYLFIIGKYFATQPGAMP